MTATPVARVTDTADRATITANIVVLRAKAARLSRHDPRRDEIDAEVDALVSDWLKAER